MTAYYIVAADDLGDTRYYTNTAASYSSALQEALDNGSVTRPGRYAVACPGGAALNIVEFEVVRPPAPELVIVDV